MKKVELEYKIKNHSLVLKSLRRNKIKSNFFYDKNLVSTNIV